MQSHSIAHKLAKERLVGPCCCLFTWPVFLIPAILQGLHMCNNATCAQSYCARYYNLKTFGAFADMRRGFSYKSLSQYKLSRCAQILQWILSLTQTCWFRYSSSIGGFRLDESNSLSHMQAGSVTIRWTTSKPYESTIVCTAVRCRLVGLDMRHASPSVANNFAVYNQVHFRRNWHQNVAAWMWSNACWLKL